jgi:ubiquitin-protein ligase
MNSIRSVRLGNEFERLKKLDSESSLFKIMATRGDPPESYLLSFNLRSLVKNENGEIVEYDGVHLVEIFCPPRYPSDAVRILFLDPANIFHPNILCPVICLNRWIPSMFLDEICHRIAAVVGYRMFTMDENESLNRDACVWARHHQDRFPVDTRSLIDRHLKIEVW